MKKEITICLAGLVLAVSCILSGCSAKNKATPASFDASDYVRISEMTEAGDNPEAFAATCEPIKNFDSQLSVPTYIAQYDDTWFIVDCYHNRIIYSDTLGEPLTQWNIMTSDVTRPHTIASDGKVYIVDDTENNRIMVFEKVDGKFINTQIIRDVGSRPHYTVYDEDTDTFYVWSSTTGELFCLRHTEDSNRMYVTDIRKIDILDGVYVRSFSIIDGDIYFVSGVSDAGLPARIYQCSLDDLQIKKEIDVPDALAGMVQITKIQKYYYITTSTDKSGDQNYATIIKTKSLENLISGKYEDIYSTYFVGGGTPYYISNAGDTYFLTEHRLSGHSIWSFEVNRNKIVNVKSLY